MQSYWSQQVNLQRVYVRELDCEYANDKIFYDSYVLSSILSTILGKNLCIKSSMCFPRYREKEASLCICDSFLNLFIVTVYFLLVC